MTKDLFKMEWWDNFNHDIHNKLKGKDKEDLLKRINKDELDEIYEHDITQLLNSSGVEGVVDYMKKEITLVRNTWMGVCILAIIITLLCSCGEIVPDEVIDDRIPVEYGYYKPKYMAP